MQQGVYRDLKANGKSNYRAGLTHRGKHISLGSYQTESRASRAYLYAKSILKDNSVTVSAYPDKCPLYFDKYVSIINLRDNGIYFSNPIYVNNSYFGYYLSPSKELKFDMDDLFYFSQHKIMERGNHLFVAEYGMQTSLRERFGILSFSVPGRDFLFVNGDQTDYRRANIEIINHYHGVRRKSTPLKTTYKAVIHLRSDYVVGKYATEVEAAIAYNKAADILIKNGFKKNFLLNYVDEVSPKEYAEIYTNVNVSEKICSLKPASI